jgi:hypothetical protein
MAVTVGFSNPQFRRIVAIISPVSPLRRQIFSIFCPVLHPVRSGDDGAVAAEKFPH